MDSTVQLARCRFWVIFVSTVCTVIVFVICVNPSLLTKSSVWHSAHSPLFRLRRHWARAVEYPNPRGVEKISWRRDPRWLPFEQSSGGNRGSRERISISTEEKEARERKCWLPVWAGNGHYARSAWSIVNFDPSKEFPRRTDHVYCFFIAAK